MITIKHIYISPLGGSITCFRSGNSRLFQSCAASYCVSAANLHLAKACLDNLESCKRLRPSRTADFSIQRKTTLKWNSDGDLSAVDMARILDRISNPQLTKCDLDKNLDTYSLEDSKNLSQEPLPSSVWLP